MADDAAGANPFFYVLKGAVHILFVDDDPIMREFAAVHLSSDEGHVSVAADGEAALGAIASRLPDVVLLDLEMPRMDGFETLARLRADPRTRHIPVIVVTGREDVAAIDRAFDAGATSFLVKPINWRLLAYQVRFVRRAQHSLAGLRQERAKTAAVQARMTQVTRAAAGLIQQAVRGPPDLRRTALEYAALIADAHDLSPSTADERPPA